LHLLGGLFTAEDVNILNVLGIGKLLHSEHRHEAVVMSDTTALRLQQLVRKLLSNTSCILFLDDLQWAHDASRELLYALLQDHTLDFCLVGAIRTGEVTTFEPPTEVEIEQLSLKGLCVNDVHHWLRFVEQPQPLVTTVWTITGGNPYFTRQYLESMVLEGTLFRESESWKYQPQALVASSSQLGSVLDLLVAKIRLVKPVTQTLLVLTSALGHIVREDVTEICSTQPSCSQDSLHPFWIADCCKHP